MENHYTPWFASDDAFFEEDDWISYLRRNTMHSIGEESPFPGSSWSYISDNDRADETLHDKITHTLYENPDIDASAIRLIVLHGSILLFGTVGAQSQKNAAENIVKNLPGVWKVQNDLSVEAEGYNFQQ